MRPLDDYIILATLLAILIAIIYLGNFLLKKESIWLQVPGGIIIVGLILSIMFILLGLLYISDETEINELIKQGYLPADYTTEDIFKLCNPQTDSEREALEGAPNHAMTCYTRGGD